jgi:hypothetical protein
MKRKFKALTIIVFAALVLAIPLVYAAEPQQLEPADAIWIEPSTVDLVAAGADVGYKFNVTVWMNLMESSASWQFELVYNKTLLNATGCGYSAGDKSDFYHNVTTIPLAPKFFVYNSTYDLVTFAESWMLGATRSPGYGSLAWVEFQVLVHPGNQSLPSMMTFEDLGTTELAETYAQTTVGTKILLNGYGASLTPEFLSLAAVILLMCMITVAVLTRKLKCYSRR